MCFRLQVWWAVINVQGIMGNIGNAGWGAVMEVLLGVCCNGSERLMVCVRQLRCSASMCDRCVRASEASWSLTCGIISSSQPHERSLFATTSFTSSLSSQVALLAFSSRALIYGTAGVLCRGRGGQCSLLWLLTCVCVYAHAHWWFNYRGS